jgi:uncharacterized membrane protein
MNWHFEATDRPLLLAAIYISAGCASVLLLALLAWLARRWRL